MVGGKRRNLRKSLRDAYNDALLRANLTQEIKDALFGHKGEGAKEKYAISQATIIDAYNKAFQFLTVNHGTQARKDIEVMRTEVTKLSQIIVKQQEESQAQNEKIDNLSETVKFLAKENEIHRHAVERLLKESKEETKQ
jgi:hypothetical protein